MQGFSVPLSPRGLASLTPTPPWFYAGNLLVVDYAADPGAVEEVLPPGLTPMTLAGASPSSRTGSTRAGTAGRPPTRRAASTRSSCCW
jgi:hypothetical protein